MQTELCVILDRSGSMQVVAHDVEGGFNNFMAEQRKHPDRCLVSLTQFDSAEIETVYSGRPVQDVPALVFEPRALTPLLDAVGRTVTALRDRLTAAKSTDRVLVMIITDGHENHSREWTNDGVKRLVEAQKAAGWEFMYLGADVNAFDEAGKLGISQATASPYDKSSRGIQAMMAVASASTRRYRDGGAAAFTTGEREQLEEKHDTPARTPPAPTTPAPSSRWPKEKINP